MAPAVAIMAVAPIRLSRRLFIVVGFGNETMSYDLSAYIYLALFAAKGIDVDTRGERAGGD